MGGKREQTYGFDLLQYKVRFGLGLDFGIFHLEHTLCIRCESVLSAVSLSNEARIHHSGTRAEVRQGRGSAGSKSMSHGGKNSLRGDLAYCRRHVYADQTP